MLDNYQDLQGRKPKYHTEIKSCDSLLPIEKSHISNFKISEITTDAEKDNQSI